MKVNGYYVNENDTGLIVFSIVKIIGKKRIACGTAYVDGDDNVERINVIYKPQKGMSVNERIECFKKWALDNVLSMESTEIYVKSIVLNRETKRRQTKYIPIGNFTKSDFKC